MKKLLILALFAVLAACSSDDEKNDDPQTSDVDNSGLTLVPEAKAEFNDASFGIYKGIVVGGSGVVTVDLYNSDVIAAKMVIDGITHDFTTSEPVLPGQAVSGLTFTKGDMSFDFNVSATGIDPRITNIVIPDHPLANFEIIKEYSDALVRCYQGTFSGDTSGAFNLIRIENALYGLYKPQGDQFSYWLEGSIGTDLAIAGVMDAGTFSGFVNGSTFGGSWQNGGENGSWTGQRTL